MRGCNCEEETYQASDDEGNAEPSSVLDQPPDVCDGENSHADSGDGPANQGGCVRPEHIFGWCV
jgi:hypothetical protein